MDAETAQRAKSSALMVAAVLAYVARPWSCGYVLSQFTPDDPVPYAQFDYHGWGVMLAWLMAVLFALPVLWFAAKIFLSDHIKLGVFGRARNAQATFISVLIALGIGAPMHSQLSYLIGLPFRLAAPVLISSVAWLLIVEIARTAAVEGNLLSKGAVRVAAMLAAVVAVPKLTLVGIALAQS